jgi:glutamine synthetase
MSAETPHSLAEKKFHNLEPLTPGSRYHGIYDVSAQQVSIDDHLAVHGYSLLRTQLNNDYFRDIFNYAATFDIAIEGHRACITLFLTSCM